MQDALSLKTSMEFEYGKARQLSPGVARLVANNPGPFTFKGTNTYILGTTELCVIDPGPDDVNHHEALMAAISGRPVSHILITHTHRDHIDGLERLREATGAVVCGYGRTSMPTGPTVSPSGGEFVQYDFRPDVVLRDGDAICGQGWVLRAVHTPGHAPDHLCFRLEGRGILFSGDHVMAWNTTVVAPPEGRMADYLASLERLIGAGDKIYLPGHGGRLEDPDRMVRAYLVHRQWREQAILTAIRDGHRTIRDIVALVYRGLDERLVTAACLSAQAHVEHLIDRGLVTCHGTPSFDQPLSAV
ncbi:MAG TPA: MBL fold metallo-hydrolase [Hyphomicrobiaceae bacterium]|nr:MBL fold metallo-hydrolase [Hyphomicrobiaceae bacterium]